MLETIQILALPKKYILTGIATSWEVQSAASNQMTTYGVMVCYFNFVLVKRSFKKNKFR